MSKIFPGFSPEALKFFQDLSRNNTRDWFQPRKDYFTEHVRTPMLELVECVNQELADFSPEHVMDPGKAVYRIYRDTRFSKDKTPYKTHIAANFWHRTGPKHSSGGYYCSVSHESVEVACGIYMPEPPDLITLRRTISKRHDEIQKMLGAKPLVKLLGKIQGERLSRVPKGFLTDDPAADLLKHKQLYFYVTLDPAMATTKKLQKEIVDRFRAAAPFVQFVNTVLQPGWKKAAREAEFFA